VTRDGKRVAFLKGRQQSDVYLGELPAGATRIENVRRLTLDERDDHPSGWTRDSKSVYFSSNRQGTTDIFTQGVLDRTADVVVAGPDSEYGAQLSPDGAYLLYRSRRSPRRGTPVRVMRVPVAGGPPELVLEKTYIYGITCPQAPGASCILIEHGEEYRDHTLSFYALDPLKGLGRKIGEDLTMLKPSWSLSPDGTRIAFADTPDESGSSESSKIRTMNVADGRTQEMRVDGLRHLADLNWSADGKGLFVVDNPSGWRVIYVDLEGHMNVLYQSESNAKLNAPLQSPDGRYLAFEAMTIESNAWLLENF
jgi:Tol biopolymer transport system component